MLSDNFHSKLFFGIILLSLWVSSCAPSAKLSPEQLTNARNYKPAADKALIYVVRATNYGKMEGMKVSCDNRNIGTTYGKTFLYFQVDPGKHRIVGEAENDTDISLICEAGKTYFIQQKVKMGLLSGRNELVRVSDSDGKNMLNTCKMAAHCPGCAGKD